jgi:hypothetical protein
MEQNKYVVKVINMFANLIHVEANNEEEAKVKAKELLLTEAKEKDYPLYYESTLPEEFWAVITEDKLEELKKESESAQEVPGVEE